jgi:hypothetical protein
MRKLLLALLMFAGSLAAKERDYTLYPPVVPEPRIEAVDPIPIIFAQVNTFCAANLACTVTGAWTFGGGNSFVSFTFSNHNGMFWAGPGATPTIDQAIAACPVSPAPCFVVISPTYSGPESSGLFTTSTGYKVYNGANNITIEDFRANIATPGTPANAPLYSIGYGGRWDGEIARHFVNGYCSGTIADSCVGLASAGWFTGTFPSNNGSLYGSTSVAITHGAITVGGSASIVGGTDSEVWFDATSSDAPIADGRAYTGACVMNRANATQNVTTCSVYHATNCTLVNAPASTFTNCYGFDASNFGAGATGRDYSYHSSGNWLTENNTFWDAVDLGGTPRHMVLWR